LASLGKSEHCGVRELLKACCKDPLRPSSHEIAFGIAPRINAAGRVAHPAAALAVLDAGSDETAAEESVQRLNELNVERRRLVELHFEQLALEMDKTSPAGLVVYRKSSPKGIAGLLASRCVERFGVPSIVLTPAMDPGLAVGSGRTVPGIDLIEELRPFGHLFSRFGGHAQAIGLTMPLENISEFQQAFARALESRGAKSRINLRGEAELSLSLVGPRFYDQLLLLEPFGEGNRAPLFSVSRAEVVSVKNRWVRIRQGKNTLELLCWELPVPEKMYGEFLVEFYGQTRVLRGYSTK
jgi:single-stranded-DNA-specific exonuclease